MRTNCVAVFAPLSGGMWATGAGFLIRGKMGLYLMTAAHNPIQRQPTADFSLWPEYLYWRTPNAEGKLRLFSQEGVIRLPTFRYRTQPGGIEDILAIPMPADELPVEMIRDISVVVDLQHSREQPSTEGELSAHGFPGVREDRWPYWPADRVTGRIRGSRGRLMNATIPVQKGHSGGPVFNSTGDFVGMVIGRDPCEIVPQAVLVDFMSSADRSLSL